MSDNCGYKFIFLLVFYNLCFGDLGVDVLFGRIIRVMEEKSFGII